MTERGKREEVRWTCNDEIVVERGPKGSVEVRFKNPDMARIVAAMVQATRFMPRSVRESLTRQDLMEDVANTIYMAAVEFRRTRTKIEFTGDVRKDRAIYKDATRLAWRNLYAMLRNNVPDYKRKYYTKFMNPSKLKNVEAPQNGKIAFAVESELMRAEIDP